MKYKLAKKAYAINLDKIDKGYLYAENIVYAENRNSAKMQLLQSPYKYDYICLRETPNDEVTYLTIPVNRRKAYDLYFFEDKELSMDDIERELEKRKKLLEYENILNDENITHCYIKKGGYYYRPNNSGYTEYITKAGIYLKEDAISSAKSCQELKIIPIDVEKHNNDLFVEIKDIESRLILKNNIDKARNYLINYIKQDFDIKTEENGNQEYLLNGERIFYISKQYNTLEANYNKTWYVFSTKYDMNLHEIVKLYSDVLTIFFKLEKIYPIEPLELIPF